MSDTVQQERPEDNSKGDKRSTQPSQVQAGDKFTIYPGSRMADYDVGDIKAYMASDKSTGEKCFALVCEPHLVPRLRSAQVYSSIINQTLVPLAGLQVVDWPPAKQERCLFIYKDVLGKRVLLPGQRPALGWKQEQVMAAVVMPVVNALKDFSNKDFIHGAIRASNMFEGSRSGKVEKIILGDCLTTPPSYMQPALYETIERAMADPISRGMGSAADDMYAFGISLAVLMRSSDPLQGLSHAEVVKKKMELGTYTAVTGKDRFKGSILELLRGLLHDNPSERWTIDEVISWLDGQRLSPKQSVVQKKAPRPVVFAGHKYFQIPQLAMDLPENPGEAVRLVESGDLEQWLKRSIEDDEALERVEKAIKIAWDSGTGAAYEANLVCHLSMALDPEAPVRFKGMKLMGEGVGAALAEAIVLKKDIRPFADMFLHGILMNWITNHRKVHVDTGSLISRFDSCRSFMRQSRSGFGIERCLYLMCPEVHCLSERLYNYFVRSPEDMIMAFEDICANGRATSLFLDRHCTAFLSVKDSKSIDPYLYDLDGSELHKKILANLKCFATIQKRSNMRGLPNLAKAFSAMLPAVYERYHDRQVREYIQSTIEGYVQSGDLGKMAALLDNADVSGRDIAGFREAMREYKDLSEEAARLEISMRHREKFGKRTGKEIAAVVSGILSGIIILCMIFLVMSNHKFF